MSSSQRLRGGRDEQIQQHTHVISHREGWNTAHTSSPRPGALGLPVFDRPPTTRDRAGQSPLSASHSLSSRPSSLSSDRSAHPSASYSQSVHLEGHMSPPYGHQISAQSRDGSLDKTMASRLTYSRSVSSLPASGWRTPVEFADDDSPSGGVVGDQTPGPVRARLLQTPALNRSGSRSPRLGRSDSTTPRGWSNELLSVPSELPRSLQAIPLTPDSPATCASSFSSRSGPSLRSRGDHPDLLDSPAGSVNSMQVHTDGGGYVSPGVRRARSMLAADSPQTSSWPQYPQDAAPLGSPSSSAWTEEAAASLEPTRHSRHQVYTPSTLSRRTSSTSLAPQFSSVSLHSTNSDTGVSASREPLPVLDLRRLNRAVSLAVDATNVLDESNEQRQSVAFQASAGHSDNWENHDTSNYRWDDHMAMDSQPAVYINEPGSDSTIPTHAGVVLPPSSLAVSPLNSVAAEYGTSSARSDVSNESGSVPTSRIGRLLRLPRSSAAGAASLLRRVTRGSANAESSSSVVCSSDEQDAVALARSVEQQRRREQERQDSDLSLALYVSSINFMLSALSPESAQGVSERHRAEMRTTLMEALHKLESTAPKTSSHQIPAVVEETTGVQTEIAGLRRELQAALNTLTPSSSAAELQTVQRPTTVHHIHTHTLAPTTVSIFASVPEQPEEPTPPADPPARPGWPRRMFSTIAWGTIGMGLAASAGAVHVTARAVGWTLPVDRERWISTTSPTASGETPETDSYPMEQVSSPMEKEAKVAVETATFISQLLTGAARFMAGGATSNDRRLVQGFGGRASLAVSWISERVPRQAPRGRAEEQLVHTAAELGRAVKRSQLPTQLALLTQHLLILMSVLNNKYALRRRTVDFVLNALSASLKFVRIRGWHVYATRTLVAGLEAAIAAVQAYRETDEENRSSMTRRLGAPPAYALAVASN